MREWKACYGYGFNSNRAADVNARLMRDQFLSRVNRESSGKLS